MSGSKRYASDLDADDIIRRAEAELSSGPPRNESVSRTPCIMISVFFLLFVVFLPRIQVGGYVDHKGSGAGGVPLGGGVLPKGKGGGGVVAAGSAGGKHPPFKGDCTRMRKKLPSSWPWKGSAHVQRYWIHKNPSGPTKYSHMAMIEQLGNGTFVAAWQASGGLEGTDDQHIVLSFSQDLEGKRWGEPYPLPVRREAAQWSPVLHADPRGRLWLFYAESTECKSKTSPPRWYPGGDIKVTMWGEGGDRWKAPRVIYSQSASGRVPKVIANKLIVLTGGEWVLPYWEESHPGGTCSFDENTWLIENTVAEIRSGMLLMLFRTLKGYIYQAISDDKGRTWTRPEATNLPNPDSKIHMLPLADGSLALAYNHHPKLKRPNRRARTNLDVAVSINDGRSWKQVARVEDQQDAGLRMHYPTLMQSGCTLYLAYSKFYHEEFAYKGEGNSSGVELGIKLVALDIR